MWHVSSRSGVTTLRTAVHLLLTYWLRVLVSVCVCVGADTTGKLIRDGVEVKSSDEAMDEDKQRKLWELTGGYAHLDGFAALDVPPPPAEPVPEEPKTAEPKAEEANGETAKESGDTPVITADSNKTDEAKTQEKGAGRYR